MMPARDASQSLSFSDLTQLLRQIFLRHGTSVEVADILARNCATAQRDGAHSHGTFRSNK